MTQIYDSTYASNHQSNSIKFLASSELNLTSATWWVVNSDWWLDSWLLLLVLLQTLLHRWLLLFLESSALVSILISILAAGFESIIGAIITKWEIALTAWSLMQFNRSVHVLLLFFLVPETSWELLVSYLVTSWVLN